MQRLRGLGIRLSIDDFGTGHSSLAQLKRLPVDELKIDKSFVMELTSNRDDAAIVRSTIDLAHCMGLKVTAEGVEDQAIQDLLASMGCDVAQGYHLSRPLPGDAFETWFIETEHHDGVPDRHAG
jgi:EAL domain-containing protein (putative c-di-GMP-specific phosphodiesterase class I)